MTAIGEIISEQNQEEIQRREVLGGIGVYLWMIVRGGCFPVKMNLNRQKKKRKKDENLNVEMNTGEENEDEKEALDD